MTRQQQRRADAKNGAAYIASGAAILAAALVGLVLIALIVGVAAQGIGYALAAVATIAYLRTRDRHAQERRTAARAAANALAREDSEDRQRRNAYAANALARREIPGL